MRTVRVCLVVHRKFNVCVQLVTIVYRLLDWKHCLKKNWHSHFAKIFENIPKIFRNVPFREVWSNHLGYRLQQDIKLILYLLSPKLTIFSKNCLVSPLKIENRQKVCHLTLFLFYWITFTGRSRSAAISKGVLTLGGPWFVILFIFPFFQYKLSNMQNKPHH